jgi:nucleoside-diphosphate-sugar epimerase
MDTILNPDDVLLVTGANGFVGTKVVEALLRYGFRRLRCFVRPSSDRTRFNEAIRPFGNDRIEVVEGNLLSRDDCRGATKDVLGILHLAAGTDKSFANVVMNSVVTTRNLLDSIVGNSRFKRFVNVSSLAVYSNVNLKRGGLLDESCEVDNSPELRFEAYTYGKIMQDDLLMEYGEKYNIPYVILRPGVVFGPGKRFIPARVGIDTFGIFLHIGGRIRVPLTYVDNCAEAIVLAAITRGIDGEVINILDDNLPTSRGFLRLYKKHVRRIRSLYVPYRLFYVFCYVWELYSKRSRGQLPPVFNRRRCAVYWKGNRYSNRKAKELLGWKPRTSFHDALMQYFEYQKEA